MPLERVVKALYEYEATEEDELTFNEDDLLAVTNTDNEEWLLATRLDDGTSGLIPINYIEDLECLAVMKSGFDYAANESNELSMKEGETVYVLSRVEEEWWLVRNEAGVHGLVPTNYLEEPSEGKAQEIHFESHWRGKFVDGKKKFEGVFGLTDDQHVAFLSQDSALFMVPLKSVASFEAGTLKCKDGKAFTLELSARDALAFSGLINPKKQERESASKECTYIALYNYDAGEEDEVSLREGERVTLLEHQDDDWSLVGLSNGTSGLVPRSYIADALSKDFEHMTLQSWTEVESSDYKSSPEIISSSGGKQSTTSPEIVSESASVRESIAPQKVTDTTIPVIHSSSPKVVEIPPPPPMPVPTGSPIPVPPPLPTVPSPREQSSIPPPPPMPTVSSPREQSPIPPPPPMPAVSSPKMASPSLSPPAPKPVSSPSIKLPTASPQQALSKPVVKAAVPPSPIYQQKANVSASSLSPREDLVQMRTGLKSTSPIVAPTQPAPQVTSASNTDAWAVPKRDVLKASITKPQWITKDVSPSLPRREILQQPIKKSPEMPKPAVSVQPVTSPKTGRPSLSELAKKYGTPRTPAPVAVPQEAPKPTENPWGNLSIKKSSTKPAPVKKSLPDRPEHATSSTKPKPGNTRLWNDRSGKFQVEAEYLSFSNGQVELLKLNGKKVAVPLDMLSERDVEFVYRKEGLPIETAQPSSTSSPSPGAWLTLLLEIGIDRARASNYSQVLAKEKLVPTQFTDLTRDFLKGRGFTEADILVFLKAAAKKKAATLEQSATRSNLERVRSMSRSPDGTASLVPYKLPSVKSPILSPTITTSNAPVIHQPSSITTYTASPKKPSPSTTYTASQTLETTRTRAQRTFTEPVVTNNVRSPPPPTRPSYDNPPIPTASMGTMDIRPYERPHVQQQMTPYQPPIQNYHQPVYQPPPMPAPYAPMHSVYPPYAQPMPQVHHNIVVTKYTTNNNTSQGSANSFSQQRPPMMPPHQPASYPYPPNPYQQAPHSLPFPPQNPFMNPFQQFPPGGHFPPYGQGGYY